MATSQEEAPVSFDGYWKLQRNDENFEKYLSTVGLNFVLRKMIKAATVYQDIEQEGNSFTIKVILPITTQEMKFVVGEDFEFYHSMRKETIQRTARWEGQKLVITSAKEDANEPVETREMEEELLVLTLSKGGVTTKRYFEKSKK